MSGISGVFYHNKKNKVDIGEIETMLSEINHRGPDGITCYAKDNFGFGFCRKKIGDAPFKLDDLLSNENEDIYLACDGLIYNFEELRQDLLRDGHRFKTTTDIEVLLHLYEKEGLSFCEKLEGNFAFALWDQGKEWLILGRDHLGVKPLYFLNDGKRFIFSSEIKSLLVYPGFKKRINFEALCHYFFDRVIPSPLTIFDGVYSVNPATTLVIKRGKILEKKYWHLRFETKYRIGDIAEISNLIRDRLESSVRARLKFIPSPVLALSGGLDSSLLLSIIKCYTHKPVRTLYIRYPKKSLNKNIEFDRVKKIVKILKSDHVNYALEPDDYLTQFEESIAALDNPIAMYSNYYFLGKAVRETYGTDIFLEGDGSEELFGGYWYHFLAKKMETGGYKYDRTAAKNDLNLNIKKILSHIENYDWRFGRPLIPVFTVRDGSLIFVSNIWKKVAKDDICRYARKILEESIAEEFLNKVLELDTNVFLPNHTLQVIDRLSMINSVVPCSPFVNVGLFELSGRISSSLKINNAEVAKFILREAARGLIPEEFIYSKYKEGGGVPIRQWLLMDSYEKFIKNVLSRKRIKMHSFFKPDFVINLVKEHYRNKSYFWDKKGNNIKLQKSGLDHTIKIWKLVIFQLWWENHFG